MRQRSRGLPTFSTLRNSTQKALATLTPGVAPREIIPSAELPRSDRIEIFGSNISGARVLRSLLESFINIQDDPPELTINHTRYVNFIGRAFFHGATEETPQSVPFGVIALPAMRFRTQDQTTMFVEAPIDTIRALCTEHDVPLCVVTNEQLQGDGALCQATQALQMAIGHLALPSAD